MRAQSLSFGDASNGPVIVAVLRLELLDLDDLYKCQILARQCDFRLKQSLQIVLLLHFISVYSLVFFAHYWLRREAGTAIDAKQGRLYSTKYEIASKALHRGRSKSTCLIRKGSSTR